MGYTYTTLKTAIANYADRSDLTSYLDDFIAQAEARFQNDPAPIDPSILPGIRCRNMFKRVTTSASTEYFDTPTDLLEIKRITIQGNTDYSLQYMSPWMIQEKYPGNTTGIPKHYTIIGDEIQIKPVFSDASTIEIAYYASLTGLSDSNASNWLSTNKPQIYLYSCMIEAGIFTDDDAMIQKYSQLYRSAATGLNRAEKRAQYGGQLTSRVGGATP